MPTPRFIENVGAVAEQDGSSRKVKGFNPIARSFLNLEVSKFNSITFNDFIVKLLGVQSKLACSNSWLLLLNQQFTFKWDK